MNKVFQHRYMFRGKMLLMIGLCLCVYFTYHAINGERSYIKLMSLKADISITQSLYEGLEKDRKVLESKVVMLRPGTIDKDLLEERARAVLGYRHEGEMDIVTQ